MKDTCEAKLISVIVPVHNVARYLVQCVESICSQTYKNLQIILIEDGSTDGSDRICDEFDDPRIEVIHSTTRGLSAARNVGIGRAKGELIAFVDSDDYLMPKMYEILAGMMKDPDIDFSACGIAYYEDGVQKGKAEEHGKVHKYDFAESVDALCDKYMFMVWNKLYRRNLIGDILFEDVSFEDVGFMRKLFNRIRYTAYSDEKLYVYRVMNTGSTSFNRDRHFHKKHLPVIEEYERLIDALEQKKLYGQASRMRGQQLGRIKQIYNLTTDDDKESKQKIHTMFKKRLFRNSGWKTYTISYMIFFIFPEISRKKYEKMIENKLKKDL